MSQIQRRKMMMSSIETTIMGIAGTALSAIGASISVTELQAIISIIVTVAGFLLGVVLPWVIKLIKKIREAKKDGVITEEEKDDIINTIGEAGEDISSHLPKDKE